MLSEETTPGGGSTNATLRALQTLRRRIGTIVLTAVVTTGSALGFSMLQTPTYEASVQILVDQKATGNVLFRTEAEDLQDLAQTVATAVPTTPVAEAVVERLDLSEGSAGRVLRNTSAKMVPGTMFVNVSYKDPDPERAQLIANTIGQALSEKMSEVSLGATATTATVWAPATLPETPVSPDPVRNGGLALLLGSFLGVVLAFLLEYVRPTLHSREEVEEVSGVPTLSVIPKFEVSARRQAILVSRRKAILASKIGGQ